MIDRGVGPCVREVSNLDGIGRHMKASAASWSMLRIELRCSNNGGVAFSAEDLRECLSERNVRAIPPQRAQQG